MQHSPLWLCVCIWACECKRERQQETLEHCLSSGVAQKVALIAQKVVQCTKSCIEQFGFPSSNPHCSLTDHNARSNIQLLMIAQHSLRIFNIYHVALRKLHTDSVARSSPRCIKHLASCTFFLKNNLAFHGHDTFLFRLFHSSIAPQYSDIIAWANLHLWHFGQRPSG